MFTALEEKQMISYILRDTSVYMVSEGCCKPLWPEGLGNLYHLIVCNSIKFKGHLPEYKFLKRSPAAQRFADVSQKEAQWLLSKMSQPLNAS